LPLAAGWEIRFLARPTKADALIDVATLIAPGALIQVEETTIVHAATSKADPVQERASWEAGLSFRGGVAVNEKCFGQDEAGAQRRRTLMRHSGRSNAHTSGETT